VSQPLRRIAVPPILILMKVFVFSSGICAQTSAAALDKVAALEAQWLEAQKTSNPALLEPLLAPTFFNVSTDSTVSNKTETLRLVKAARFAVAEYLDVKVRVYGGTAVASGVFHGKATDGSEVLERWTDTWVKTGKDRWRCVASHASPMKK
jgi:hypothetical protein